MKKINKNEFLSHCTDGEKYWPLVEYAESLARGKDNFIGLRYDNPFSSYQNPWIRWFIGTDDNVFSAAKAISHLFHELGHMMQPEIKIGDAESIEGSDEQIKREEEAWTIGKNHIINSRILSDNEFWQTFEAEEKRIVIDRKNRRLKNRPNV